MARRRGEWRAIGTSLGDLTEGNHDATQVLVAVLDQIGERLTQLAVRDARLADCWKELCVLRGGRLEVAVGPRSIEGNCLGIDNDGALLVETPAGVERIFGGIVRSHKAG